MMLITFRGLRSSLRGRPFSILFVSLVFGWCGKKEMLGYLRIDGEQKRCCGTYYISTPPFGPLVPSLLGEFHLMLFN